MNQNFIKDRSYNFALRIVKLSRLIAESKKEFVLSKQVLRSGTAIGALVREAEQAESKADFIHKLAIALKESNETEYWLLLLKDSGFISQIEFESLETDIKAILKLLTSIIKSSKAVRNQVL